MNHLHITTRFTAIAQSAKIAAIIQNIRGAVRGPIVPIALRLGFACFFVGGQVKAIIRI
jgi:type IV secretory pathway VirB2 component (pilin)